MVLSIEEIYKGVEDIVTLAEMADGFYEVEVCVLVRRNGGSEGDFIRMQLEKYDGECSARKLTVKNYHNSNKWF